MGCTAHLMQSVNLNQCQKYYLGCCEGTFLKVQQSTTSPVLHFTGVQIVKKSIDVEVSVSFHAIAKV